ncbi:NPCBM/NEW2 domain-containing protein [uncultured Bifidobacterium sp.]|uniref:NPCBM/NEW2 domain-containing protein n=1 Tax=uncultured Bifidobacterium sp. TaxID=165187 RepID=UPI0025830C4C|nr:NPCBM/NEW2 domain-containing protein [uncultured Bifidobacterium sp.]
MDETDKPMRETESSEERINKRHPIKVAIITGAIIAIIGALAGGVVTHYFQGNQIVEELARRFDFVDENGSLNDALESLYAELDARADQIQQLKSDDAGQKAIASAAAKWDSEEYAEAIRILSEVTDESSQAYAVYVDYCSQFVDITLKQVDTLIANKDYEGADSLLDEAIEVVKDSDFLDELKKKKQEIEDSRPEDMLEVVPAYQSGGNTYTEYSSKKSGEIDSFNMGGVKYTSGMTFSADINIFNDVSWAIYNLDEKYQSLEFVTCHVDGTDNGNSTTLQIFYDGELKEEISLAPDMSPKVVNLDLTGVRQLKLQVPASGGNGPVYGIGNPKIKLA